MLMDQEKMENDKVCLKRTVQEPNFGFVFDLNFIRFMFLCLKYNRLKNIYLVISLYSRRHKKRKPSHNPTLAITKEVIDLLLMCLGYWPNVFFYIFKTEQETVEARIRAVTFRKVILNWGWFCPPLPPEGHLVLYGGYF